jgi:hypothetical protein
MQSGGGGLVLPQGGLVHKHLALIGVCSLLTDSHSFQCTLACISMKLGCPWAETLQVLQ